MKKIYYFLLPLLVISSCAKEFEVEEPANESATVELKAVIDNTETKTDYTISGSEAVFCWKGTEEIGRLAWGGYFTQTVYTSTTAASSGETELTFSGAEVTNDSGYAVYPPRGASNGAGFNWYSADGYLDLGESIVYNPNAPLQNIVPMLGKLGADGKYVFKPVTGVIGVRLLHIPATATKVTISSTTTKLSKGFRNTASGTFPDEMDAIYNGGLSLAAPKSDAKNTKSYTFTAGSLDFDTEYTFYYPIPVGTITGGLTVTVYNGSTELISKSSSKDQVVKLATITRLPLITLPTVIESWTSMGTGKFIDTYVWGNKGFGTDPVEVEFFKSSLTGRYRMANPYAEAATAHSLSITNADDYLVFNVGEKGRVSYECANMGFTLSESGKNSTDRWAIVDGETAAGYGNDYNHVVSYTAAGEVANIQLAPCYRTEGSNMTGYPTDYNNEIGKNNEDGIVEIAFPGSEILMPYTITTITVSSNSGDSAGAAGLIDNNLGNCWHTPWGSPSTGFSTTYGEYVDITLDEGVSSFAFNYCTRNTTAQGGAPAKVVVGGSTDGTNFTILGTFEYGYMTSSAPNTWIGLPVVNASAYAVLRFGVAKNQNKHDLCNVTSADQWCNLAELKIFGITTGAAAPFAPSWLETNQVYIKQTQITVNCDAGTRDGLAHYDGQGKAALVDNDHTNFWHTPWAAPESAISWYGDGGAYGSLLVGYTATDVYGYSDLDADYGACIDIALKESIQKFHVSYYIRSTNANGEPREIKIAGSNDGSSWTLLSTVADDGLMKQAAGSRVDLPVVDALVAYSHLRIGITKAGNGDTPNDISPSSSGSTALAEILLFKD